MQQIVLKLNHGNFFCPITGQNILGSENCDAKLIAQFPAPGIFAWIWITVKKRPSPRIYPVVNPLGIPWNLLWDKIFLMPRAIRLIMALI
jgi:hypothetical protein